MTIQQFEYVLAVIDHGSFSGAAEACFVTQPTLSSQISKLERELGFQLLDRMSRPVRPAPGADGILERAGTAVRMMKSISGLAADLSDTVSGELKIGIIPTLSPYLLPLFLGDFLNGYPEVDVRISELPSDDILQGLRDFRLDCGILALPAGVPGLVEMPLFDEEFLLFLPPDRTMRGRIDIADLDRDELLLLSEGHCLRDQVLDLCGPSGPKKNRRVEFRTGCLESLKTLVNQGIGYTLLPELSVSGMDEDSRSRVHPLGPVTPYRRIGMISHPAGRRPKLQNLLAAGIIDCLPGDMPTRKADTFLPWRS